MYIFIIFVVVVIVIVIVIVIIVVVDVIVNPPSASTLELARSRFSSASLYIFTIFVAIGIIVHIHHLGNIVVVVAVVVIVNPPSARTLEIAQSRFIFITILNADLHIPLNFEVENVKQALSQGSTSILIANLTPLGNPTTNLGELRSSDFGDICHKGGQVVEPTRRRRGG